MYFRQWAVMKYDGHGTAMVMHLSVRNKSGRDKSNAWPECQARVHCVAREMDIRII